MIKLGLIKYVNLMGWRWLFFRLIYEIRKKAGYFEKKNRALLIKTRLLDWHQIVKKISLKKLDIIAPSFKGDQSFIKKANCALSGNIFSFSNQYLDYSTNGRIAWNINPITRKKASLRTSWNKLSDFADYGDIKLIWEVSRFPQIYYFISAYSLTSDKKYAEGCINQIIDWCHQNPFPNGPNYKCGQEIAFRLFSWFIALNYFHNYISKEHKATILQNIYISLLRIDVNIDYAARSVKNNHSISESAGLIVGAVLFPEFPDSDRFLKKGLSYLKREVKYQVYGDGAYIQHSMTYQRLALDVLSFTMMILQKHAISLPEEVTYAHGKMSVFLRSFMQANGWVPNYGTNDGANLFPVSNSDYRDFRPSLNFAGAVSQRVRYAIGKTEICDLFGIENSHEPMPSYKNEFRDGGYYILRDSDSFAFMRAHSYRDRPGQSDMLHLDIWHKGHNLFCDSGSFSYNSTFDRLDDFKGTIGHNTIRINETDQMNKVGHFGWSSWVESDLLSFSKDKIIAEHYGYLKPYGITHKREVQMIHNGIMVKDYIIGIYKEVKIQQIWNTLDEISQINDSLLKVGESSIQSNILARIEKSYISDYYNHYFQGRRIIFETKQAQDFSIETVIRFRCCQ